MEEKEKQKLNENSEIDEKNYQEKAVPFERKSITQMLDKDFISKIESVSEYEKHGAGRGWDNVSDALFVYDSKNGINGVDFLTLYKYSDFVIVFFDENLTEEDNQYKGKILFSHGEYFQLFGSKLNYFGTNIKYERF